MPGGPEKQFELKLRGALESHAAIVRKLHGGQFQRDLPDMLVGHGGRIFMLEVKAGKPRRDSLLPSAIIARLSPGQMYEARDWSVKARCPYWVALGDAALDRCFAYRLNSRVTDDVVEVRVRTISDAARFMLGIE